MPNMPQNMMSAADIERQLMGAAAGATPPPSGQGGPGGAFNAANFFAQFQGPAGAAPQAGGGGGVAMHPGMTRGGPGGPGMCIPGGMHPGMQGPGMQGIGGRGAPPPGMGGGFQGMRGGMGGGGRVMGFDAGSFFRQFEGNVQAPLPPMPAQAAQPGTWGASPSPPAR